MVMPNQPARYTNELLKEILNQLKLLRKDLKK